MNPREKMILGYITDYFLNDKAPTWNVIGHALKENGVDKLFGSETIPDEFLKVLFQNDEILLKQIPEFIYRHHYIIMMLMKEEYTLSNCQECGYFMRGKSIYLFYSIFLKIF